jgi:hypothetical protein
VALLLGALAVIAVAAAAALILIPALDDEDAFPEPDEAVATSVHAIRDVPPRWHRRIVEVSGRATPLGERYFVLEGEREAIVVQRAPVDPAELVGERARVEVRGTVGYIDRLTSDRLAELLAGRRSAPLAPSAAELGDPMISAERTTMAETAS